MTTKGSGHSALCIYGSDFESISTAKQKLAAEMQLYGIVGCMNGCIGLNLCRGVERAGFDKHGDHAIGHRIR